MKVAQEAIDTIYKGETNPDSDLAYLSAWWYNVLFLYSSATVLIAARLSPSILTDISEESILESWRRAMEILEKYGVVGTSIRRLTTTLRLLFDAVPQQYSRIWQNQADAPAHSSQNQSNSATTANPSGRTTNAVGFASSPFIINPFNTSNFANDSNERLPGGLPDFDDVFDPNDLSWLMTVPLST